MTSALRVLAVAVFAFGALTMHGVSSAQAGTSIKSTKCPKWSSGGYWCPARPKLP